VAGRAGMQKHPRRVSPKAPCLGLTVLVDSISGWAGWAGLPKQPRRDSPSLGLRECRRAERSSLPRRYRGTATELPLHSHGNGATVLPRRAHTTTQLTVEYCDLARRTFGSPSTPASTSRCRKTVARSRSSRASDLERIDSTSSTNLDTQPPRAPINACAVPCIRKTTVM
jgi:hypothetical protein